MHPGCVLSMASVGRRRCTFHSCGIEGNILSWLFHKTKFLEMSNAACMIVALRKCCSHSAWLPTPNWGRAELLNQAVQGLTWISTPSLAADVSYRPLTSLCLVLLAEELTFTISRSVRWLRALGAAQILTDAPRSSPLRLQPQIQRIDDVFADKRKPPVSSPRPWQV